MRIDRSRRSTQIEDRRGMGPARGPGLKFGLGGTLLALIAAYFLGIDPRMILGVMQATQPEAGAGRPAAVQTGTPTDADGEFVAAVLGDTEDTWSEIFAVAGASYRPPKLVLFDERVTSGCGIASSGVGPFYCSKDEKIYIDLAFFRELESQFQAPGDFARAYVLAHEVGHHVQHLLGTLEDARRPEATS